MAIITAKTASDMTAWDLADLRDGDPVTNTPTAWVVDGDGGINRYVFGGTGLTYGAGANPLPDGGTIDSFNLRESGVLSLTVVGPIDAALLASFVAADDRFNLQYEWFKGADTLTGSTGNDHLLAYKGSDVFNLGKGGEDWAEGSNGDDIFNIDTALSAGDRFDGGSGNDTLNVKGTNFYDFSPVGLINVETINVLSGSSQLGFTDANIGSGGLLIDASALSSAGSLKVFMFTGNSKALTAIGGNGADVFFGGDGRDTYTGNAGVDDFHGGKGGDTNTGNGGADRFFYLAANQSTGLNYDTITDFNAANDKIMLGHAIDEVKAPLGTGQLDTATFNADMEAAITGTVMGIDDVVLFTPDSGDLQDLTFLIIDQNSKAGFQSGKDFVILMGEDSSLGGFGTEDFGIGG